MWFDKRDDREKSSGDPAEASRARANFDVWMTRFARPYEDTH
jgi:hypothetical protein